MDYSRLSVLPLGRLFVVWNKISAQYLSTRPKKTGTWGVNTIITGLFRPPFDQESSSLSILFAYENKNSIKIIFRQT